MAKRSKNASGAIVSKIPLPASDTPLVIDLPDGQKIVIGKMSRGSIVEVATWRGTGRPDSRTNRLILGVGSTQAEGDTPTPTPETSSKVSNKWLEAKTFIAKFDFQPIVSTIKGLKSNVNKQIAVVRKNDNEEFSSDVDIEEWLKKIKGRTESKLNAANKSPKRTTSTQNKAKKTGAKKRKTSK
jgi:hypothetical protein